MKKSHHTNLRAAAIEFRPHLRWFVNFTVLLDLGFQGFLDLYPCKKLIIPIKKKRKSKGIKHELTEPEIQHNKEVGKERIFVEHSIGGMKRYRILEHRNRLKKARNTQSSCGGMCCLMELHHRWINI